MILRDHDANTAWASQADGTLESRTYICQNWRADVVALMTSAGELINQVRYDPYGVPFGIAKTDLEADGDVDGDDYTRFSTLHSGGTHPYADWNWDGTVNTSDITAYLNDQSADTGLGRGDPAYAWSHAGGALRKAYAGYEIDPVLTGAEGWESLYHVRHRVYLSQLGRWSRRDPLGYVDGMSLYGYSSSRVVTHSDPSGLLPGTATPKPVVEGVALILCSVANETIAVQIAALCAAGVGVAVIAEQLGISSDCITCPTKAPSEADAPIEEAVPVLPPISIPRPIERVRRFPRVADPEYLPAACTNDGPIGDGIRCRFTCRCPKGYQTDQAGFPPSNVITTNFFCEGSPPVLCSRKKRW